MGLLLACHRGNIDSVRGILESDTGCDISVLHAASSFLIAAEKGHTDIVMLLLEKSELGLLPAPSFIDAIIQARKDGNTAAQEHFEKGNLIFSSKHGLTDTVVRMILACGTEVDSTDTEGWTSLMHSSCNGHTDTVKVMLGCGASVNTVSQQGQTSLQLASVNGHTEITELLLKSGATVNLPNNNGTTPLVMASHECYIDTARVLLDYGASVNTAGQQGQTSLQLASFQGHTEMVRLLLEKGATVNLSNSQGITPLTLASQNGHTHTVRLLLEKGAEVNLPSHSGTTALIQASQRGHTNTVRVLLNVSGLNVIVADKEGTTSLILAGQNGHTDIVRLLLQKGADVDLPAHNGTRTLIQASQNGHIDIVMLLLQKGAQVNLLGHSGTTALIQASQQGHTDIVRLLLGTGAKINSPTHEGRTAVIQASQNGHIEIVRLLLKAGAEVNLPANSETTAVMLASQQGHTDIVRLLLETGTKVSSYKQMGGTALIQASQQGHIDIVSLLLKTTTEVNLSGQDCTTALILASQEGHADTVRVLLESGVNVDIAGIVHNDTAVIVAARSAHWNTVQVLVKNRADVIQRNDNNENAVIYIAFGIYQSKWAEMFLEELTDGTSLDALHMCDYGICIASFMLIGGFVHNKPIPETFVHLFSKLRSSSTNMLQRCLYGYLPTAFHHNVKITNENVFAPYQEVEGKISLHTLGTAIVCKLPISALHWLTTQHRDYLINMLGQTPLHLLAMENHQLSDMEERIVFITEQLGFSFSHRDNNGRLVYHIACMWNNDLFLQCAQTLDPRVRNHLLQKDHVDQVCLNYTTTNTMCHTIVTSLMDSGVLQQTLHNTTKHVEGDTWDASLGNHFLKKMQLHQVEALRESLKQILFTEKDVVSLFTDEKRGVANVESKQHQYWIRTVIELLQIMGKEMGKAAPQFECEPDLKGSVQEYTKCAPLDELDVSMKLLNFTKLCGIELFQLPGNDNSLVGRLTLSPHILTAFHSLKFCTDFWLFFVETLRNKTVVQFLNKTGLIIENCKRKHGFVGMLTMSCNVNGNRLQISVDLAPCIETDRLYRYTALLRPRHYDKKWATSESPVILELSSSKKDWDFLQYVPLEVLCGYTLVKLVRSLAGTFQTEDGRVYTAEEILPSYMLKTALLWVLDPDGKFEKVYSALSKEDILHNILQDEVTTTYSADVQTMCMKLYQHSTNYTGSQDDSLWEEANRKTNVFLLSHLHMMLRDSIFQSDHSFVMLFHELQRHLDENNEELLHNEATRKYVCNIATLLYRMKNLKNEAIQLNELLQNEAFQSDRARIVSLMRELLHICQREGDNRSREHHAERNECYHDHEESNLQKLRAVHDKCVSNPGSLSWEERVLPYVLVTQCKGLRLQNGIDFKQMRKPPYVPAQLKRETTDIGKDETIYDREFYTHGQVEKITLKKTRAIHRNTNLGLAFPDITKQTAKKCRLWALRILRLLPHLLQYRGRGTNGVMNYYLPEQEVYVRDNALAVAVAFCQALEALLQQ